MATKSLRPWQGTTLAVFGIIGIVCAFLGALLLIFLQSFIIGLLTSTPSTADGTAALTGATSIFVSLGITAGIVFLALGVLEIFVVKGLLKGQRWTVIITLVFAILGAIQGLSSLGNESSPIVGIALNGFFIYCAVICLKAPFYKKK